MSDILLLILPLIGGLIVAILVDAFVLKNRSKIQGFVYLQAIILSLLFCVLLIGITFIQAPVLRFLTIGLLSFFTVLILSTNFNSRLSKTINALLRQSANPDSLIDIDYRQSDELGELIDNSKLLRERAIANERVWQSRNTKLKNKLEEISKKTAEISESITQQNSNVAETTSTMKELAATSEQTTEKAGIVVDAAEKSLELSEVGRDSVSESITNMKKIRSGVVNISSELKGLNDQISQIADFVMKVSNVAKKTNLLAINASIEASKAGESGKGFSVVSDEIRKLAEQTQGLVQDVDADVKKIIHKTEQTRSVTDKGIQLVDDGVIQIQETGEVVSESMKQLELNVISAQQILAANRQQSIGMEQIGEAIREINLGMKELAKSSEGINRVTASITDVFKQ
jgi:methyl-accepting chemotaxis protein